MFSFFLVIFNGAYMPVRVGLTVKIGTNRAWLQIPILCSGKDQFPVGVNYGSDVLFFAGAGPIRYPFVSTDLIYNFKSGFFLYGSALEVLGYSPFIDEVDLGGGYLYRYSKNITGTISYTHFIFDDQAVLVIKSAKSSKRYRF